MAIPIDLNVVNPSILGLDLLYLITVFIVTNIIRVFFRPLAFEAKTIAKFVAALIIVFVKRLKIWTNSEHHPHLEYIHDNMVTLRESIKKGRIEVG